MSEQRWRGRAGAARATAIVTGGLYGVALCVFALAPFPAAGPAECVDAQFDPLGIVRSLPNAAAPGHPLSDPAVLALMVGFVVFLPLGVLVRVAWNRGVVVSVLAGLALSLLIELTQLTGVWGLSPCPYRAFDVVDVFVNTAGAVAGSVVSLVLPRTWRVDRRMIRDAGPARPVTRWRRGLAMSCDWVSVYFLGLVLTTPVAVGVYLVGGAQQLESSDAALDFVQTAVALAVTASVALLTRRTIGDHAARLAFRGGRLPRRGATVVRFVAGIGGYQILTAPTEGANPVSLAFVVVSIVLVFTTAGGRGLPGLASRQVLADSRERPSTPQAATTSR